MLRQGPSPGFRSSGDLLADRRYVYAKAALEAGNPTEAVDMLQQALELVPHWAPALFMLGICEDKLSHRAEAIRALECAAELDLQDELGAGLQLARLGARPAPRAAGEAYVQSLFDQYATHFEKHLVGALAYRAPEILLEAVSAVAPGRFCHVLDLGCGTGLCGAVFKPRADRLSGVDLSSGMIEEARVKSIYDRLDVAGIEAFLKAEPDASAGLLLAGDVFVYIGDLSPIFMAGARVLASGGLFAFTLQETDEGFKLGSDLRFAHARNYIEAEVTRSGLRIVTMKAAVTRQDAGYDVQGLVVVAQKT